MKLFRFKAVRGFRSVASLMAVIAGCGIVFWVVATAIEQQRYNDRPILTGYISPKGQPDPFWSPYLHRLLGVRYVPPRKPGGWAFPSPAWTEYVHPIALRLILLATPFLILRLGRPRNGCRSGNGGGDITQS